MNKRDAQAAKFTLAIGFLLIIIFLAQGISSVNIFNSNKSDSSSSAEDLLQEVLGTAPRQGSETAPIFVAEFADFQCPVCKQVSPILDQVMQKYGDQIQRTWIHTPNIANHPYALESSIAAQCASQQGKFWEYHDQLFANQSTITATSYIVLAERLKLDLEAFQKCTSDQNTKATILKHLDFAQQAGISSTPYITVNGQALEGAFTLEEIDQVIKNELNQ